MSNTKGTEITWLRSYLEKKGFKEELVKHLDEKENEIFRRTLPISWVPLNYANRIFEKAAQLVFPGDQDGLRKLGRENGKDHMSGIYKIILRVISPKNIADTYCKNWKIYHDTGTPKAEVDISGKKIVLILENHPDYPRSFGLEAMGYMEYALESVGIKNLSAEYDDSNPASRKWIFCW
jgi:hypothetical protein